MTEISETELRQMRRDGRGRASVIRKLADLALRGAPATAGADSVNIRNVWVHYLTECQSGREFLRIRHRNGEEEEINLR